MKGTKVVKNLAQAAFEPLETLRSQTVGPMLEETGRELGSFFGTPKGLGRNPREIASEDLKRARQKQKLEELNEEDNQKSQELQQRVVNQIQSQYRFEEVRVSEEQGKLKEEVVQLQSEVVKLAKAAGIDTKAHLENTGKKVGILDIRRLTTIVRFLRIKAEESKSAKELVSQRTNAKRTTGMLAWVSGKQMKVHEQGTLHLQG
jgi:hypothetical protein